MGVGLKKIFEFYRDGFRSMTLGKYLWAIVLIKLFIMFAILKLFFFKGELSVFDSQQDKGNHVKEQLIEKLPADK
ncbi:MAG: DUF4492 domain-containing protein [Bacteroidales bacterium]|nr:DUF4492 domain-containing protein [Bacteroidales bacterium]